MKLLFTLLSILLLVSCTITKRHSGPGYHVEWKKSYSKTEQEAEKAHLSDPKTDAPKEAESKLEPIVFPMDTTDWSIQKGEVGIEESEPSIIDSEPENGEVIPSLAERKVVTEEPDDVVDQPKRKVEPFSWFALGGIVLGFILSLISFLVTSPEIMLGIVTGIGILVIIFSIISLVRIIKNPDLYKGKGLTWTLFGLSAVGIGAILFMLIYLILLVTGNADFL